MRELYYASVTSVNKVFLIFWVFISPIHGVLLATGVSIFADTFVGIWRDKKLKQEVTSISGIVNKMLVYNLVVISFFVIDKFILDEVVKLAFQFDFALTKLISLVLISIEWYSINKSFKDATGKSLIDRAKDLISDFKNAKKIVKNEKN